MSSFQLTENLDYSDYPCLDFLMSLFVYQHLLCKYRSGWSNSRCISKKAYLPDLSPRPASSILHSGNPSEVFQIKAGSRGELRPGLI